MSNQQLADELNKAVLTKVKKHRVNFSFKENICGKDLADMKSISKYKKEICFLLFFIDIFVKYTRVFL